MNNVSLPPSHAYQKDLLDATLLQKLDRKADEWLIANMQQGLGSGRRSQWVKLGAQATDKEHCLLCQHTESPEVCGGAGAAPQ